jgi:hypothetical protein
MPGSRRDAYDGRRAAISLNTRMDDSQAIAAAAPSAMENPQE